MTYELARICGNHNEIPVPCCRPAQELPYQILTGRILPVAMS